MFKLFERKKSDNRLVSILTSAQAQLGCNCNKGNNPWPIVVVKAATTSPCKYPAAIERVRIIIFSIRITIHKIRVIIYGTKLTTHGI
jgi:hypothetical protein